MKAAAKIFLATLLIISLAAVAGCRDKKDHKEPFGLTVDSLEITGEVDDAEVTEVDVDGDKWTVTNKEFTGTTDTTGKDKVEIEAKDNTGNTGKKTIELK